MKKFFFLFLTFTINVFGQDQVCSSGQNLMVVQNGTLPSATAVMRGGREITTQGTLRVLVVFVRFKDDVANTATWPDYNVLPSWASTFVDPQIPANNIYSSLNMSNFFDRASGGDGNGNLGTFRIIGDVYYVTTDENRSYYNESYSAVNEHILTKLNPIVNYANYDNWKFIKNGEFYNHENVPDGKVDYIFMMWRGVSPYSEGNLGVQNLFANLTLDGKTISNSCGSTQFRYAFIRTSDGVDRSIGGTYNDNYLSTLTPAHEYTHYIFGGDNTTGHIDGRFVHRVPPIQNIGNVAFFSFMTSTSASSFSAYERYRAGWLNPDIYESNNASNVILQDTHIKNKAVMLPIRRDVNNEIREYFLIENFHTLNDYAQANPFLRRQIFNYTLRNGLLVFHIEDEDKEFPANSNLDIECADGLWDWDLSAGQSTPSDRSDDWIYRKTPAPNSSTSYDERDFIYIQVGSYLNEYTALTPGSAGGTIDLRRRYTRDAYLGDNEDFYRVGETDVFSRWSNPNTNKADLSVTNRGFEVVAYNSSTKEYTLKVAVDNSGVIALKPATPQNLQLSANTGNGIVRLTWDANGEPNIAGYEVSRRVNSGNWTVIVPNTTNIFYVDNDYLYSTYTDNHLDYKIRAKNSLGYYSIFGDVASCRGEFFAKKAIASAEVRVYLLGQNFPNPFNPTTTITYTLPQASNVMLKVYDALGREVATVVNEYKNAGYYQANFDAGKLSGGMYFYKLQAGNFTSIKKMQLVK